MDLQDPVAPTQASAATGCPSRRVTRSADGWPFPTSNLALEYPEPWAIRAAHAAHWVPETDPSTRLAVDRLGRELAERCAALGLSQRRLAASSGVSRATISRLMRGMTPGTRLSTVARILAALDGRGVEEAPGRGPPSTG